MPSSAIARTTPANTRGSRGVAWYTIEASTWLARIPRTSPAIEPRPAILKARPKAAGNTSSRCAPRPYEFPARAAVCRPSTLPFQKCRLLTASRQSRPVRPATPSPYAEETERTPVLYFTLRFKQAALSPGPQCILSMPAPVALDRGSSAPPARSHSMMMAGWGETSPAVDLR
jgi:hypothetical protein